MASTDSPVKKKQRKQKVRRAEICIIHSNDVKSEHFTHLEDQKDPDDRFQFLRNVAERRLKQPSGPTRMEDVSENLPQERMANHGYHTGCYRKFTKNIHRLEKEQTGTSSSGPLPEVLKRGQRRETGDAVIFATDCIFCNKVGFIQKRKHGTTVSENTTIFDMGGGQTIQQIAEEKGHEKLLTRIRGKCLFSVEAHYHPSCRKEYTRSSGLGRSDKDVQRQRQLELEEAHCEAFEKVCALIDLRVIQRNEIVKLSELSVYYVSLLENSEFHNPKYRSEKLKEKLLKHEIGRKLQFASLEHQQGRYTSQIVFHSSISQTEAITMAYKMGKDDSLSQVAKQLRDSIKCAFDSKEEMPWPPTAAYLENQTDVVPNELERFLKVVLSGKDDEANSRVNRLVFSIGQDICRAATNGQWSMPKHILMCLTLRHMFRSKELITLMNKMGHCESYSFSLELETAIAKAVQESASILPTSFIPRPTGPALLHSEFDNFDKLVNELYGAGSVHTAHGIMLQEASADRQDETQTHSIVPKTKQRSLQTLTDDNLSECYMTYRKSPQMINAVVSYTQGAEAVTQSMKRNILWVFLRKEEQRTCGWAGFVSLTGHPPQDLTKIGYYPVVHHPITEYKTVKECLRLAETATLEVGQQYTVTTFDLGVCMKAFPLVWNEPETYAKHIILIGTFHLTCAYFRVIGKKMAGSGLADVLLEAGLVGSGTIHGVLSGKNYSRAMLCHKMIVESLERLILQEFLCSSQQNTVFENLPAMAQQKLKNLSSSLSIETLQDCVTDPDISSFVEKYWSFGSDIAIGQMGKTPQLWVSYMDHVYLILQLHEAVKRNDFELYIQCMFRMPDLFFAYDAQNYARYMAMFALFLGNLEQTHPGATELLKLGAFSVSRSMVPGCRTDVDKTMEETFMKHSKSHGGASGTGLSGITRNHAAYERWVVTTHERSKYLAATFSMAGMSESDMHSAHKDVSKTEIKRSQQTVKKTMEAFNSFLCPFDPSMNKDKLYNVSSGAAISDEITEDLMQAEQKGAEARANFVDQRLKRNVDFFEPVKRMRLKTMANTKKKVKLTSSQSKVVEYKNQGNIVTTLLMKSEAHQLDMAEVMTYSLTPVPYSIATADGFLAKTNKAASMTFLLKGVKDDKIPHSDILTVEDGNSLFYYLQDLPNNFKQICTKLYGMTKHYQDAIVSTDSYCAGSVKALERKRRGETEKLIVKGPITRKPQDWKKFLLNEENKQQLITMMETCWSDLVGDRKVILIRNGEAHDMADDGRTIPELRSNQEETDSRVVLYCKYAADNGYGAVRVRSPDSDIFWILLYHARSINATIFFDTGHGNKKRLINVTQLSKHYSEDMCSAMLGLQAFTGCDSVSAFKGIGKVKPLKLLLKSPTHCETLKQLGEQWQVNDELLHGTETFTCAVYGKGKYNHVDEARYIMLKSKCDGDNLKSSNIDLSRLPPSRACLREHVARANYQTRIWKTAHVPISENPNPWDGHGWKESGEPAWCDDSMILPVSLVDILANDVTEDDLLSDESEDEMELGHTYNAESDESSSEDDE